MLSPIWAWLNSHDMVLQMLLLCCKALKAARLPNVLFAFLMAWGLDEECGSPLDSWRAPGLVRSYLL